MEKTGGVIRMANLASIKQRVPAKFFFVQLSHRGSLVRHISKYAKWG
ncbi:hypothetical protein RB620_14305 [Paenibacillus sp. LHD-117]|nr:hypothetical protein [Paenibacillus sp. LHD-117]MDQ6420599.1 hypothetical protein [Paenibacillus sp. LHD-117]